MRIVSLSACLVLSLCAATANAQQVDPPVAAGLAPGAGVVLLLALRGGGGAEPGPGDMVMPSGALGQDNGKIAGDAIWWAYPATATVSGTFWGCVMLVDPASGSF